MFKNLKSLFVVDESDGKGAKKNVTKTEKPKSKNTGQGNQIVKAPNPSVQKAKQPLITTTLPAKGKVTTKFMEVMLKAMEANNLEGFDYLEYKQSLQALSKMPMDEATRYQSAFAMAATMGVTSAKLIETAQFYINILLKEEQKFEQALQQQQQQNLGQKSSQVKQLDELVKQKAERIKQLTQEIEAHQKQSASLKEEVQQTGHKIEQTKQNFIASYENLKGQIDIDIQNIQKYLK